MISGRRSGANVPMWKKGMETVKQPVYVSSLLIIEKKCSVLSYMKEKDEDIGKI